ncbi:hypothetical protein [Sphingobacterium humi]|uniref:Bacteriocin n=1 Tax=Sphingobacterium humi TaxID=1796905 RepID=A0A6N8L375_9SPHI|nr:hypothetical protein [Sphingobacterium humi]MVZ62598.1 hypothetical protein [Sphingobacterium humi]
MKNFKDLNSEELRAVEGGTMSFTEWLTLFIRTGNVIGNKITDFIANFLAKITGTN